MAAQGYIGRSPGDSSNIIARQTYTPTGITTNFTFASTYSVGYIDAYLNGVRLVEGNDFTATDGSVVGLTTHAQNGDIIELVAYKTFNATNVTAANNDFSVAGNLSVTGVSTFTGAITATGGITGAVTGDATGLSGTPDITIRNLTGVAATFTGVLSYDDVTNVDSVGIITARSHVAIADSILHIGDTDTSIRFPAAGTFTVETNGSEALRVDSSQNTTFGTTSESSTSVNITASTSGNCLLSFNDTNSGQGGIRYFHSTDHMQFHTADAEKVRITSAGDVGIGTGAPETPRGNRGLEVAGTTGAEIVATRTDDNLVDGDFIGGFVFKNLDAGGTPNHFAGMYAKANGTAGAMDLHFTGDRAQYEADTSDLVIRGGDVGIGTADPGDKLHLTTTSGNCKLRIDAASAASLDFYNSGTRFSDMFTDAGTGNFTITNRQNADIIFRTNGTNERVYIKSSGEVSIGGFTPTDGAGILQISGGLRVAGSASASDTTSPYIYRTSGSDHLNFATSGTERLRIDSSGRLLINTSTSRIVEDHVGNGPQGKIQIEATNSDAIMSIISAGTADANRCGTISLGRHRNSTVGGTPTIVQDGDALGSVVFAAGDGTDMRTVGAKIHAEVDGTPGGNDMPGALVFSTCPDGSARPGSSNEHLRINSGGFFNFNSANNNNLMGRVTIFDGGNFSTASTTGSGDSDNIYLISDATSADGGYGASIAWSRIQYADRRAAAIASVQTTSDEDQVGLAFFTHPSTDATAAMVEAMRVDHAGRLLIGSTQRTVGGINCALHVEGTDANDSSITLVRNTNGATNPPYLFFGKSRSGSNGGNTRVNNGDLLGYLAWNGADGNDLDGIAAAIQVAVDGAPGSNDMPGRLEFLTTPDGNNSPSIRMGINRNGELRMGYGNSDPVSTDQVHSIGDPALDTVTTNVARLVMQEKSGIWISFKNGSGTHFGSISQNTPGVTYGSNSDYRLKDNVQDFTNGINLIKQLRPVTFNWNELSGFDTTLTQRGFLAHEVQEVEPGAVVGDKDEMDRYGNCYDAEGNKTQTNVFEHQAKEGETWIFQSEGIRDQQLDPAKLVPILTAALQEAITKIDALETRIAALEG